MRNRTFNDSLYLSCKPLLHQMSDYTGYAFRCRLCGAEFTTKEQAENHYEEEHSRTRD